MIIRDLLHTDQKVHVQLTVKTGQQVYLYVTMFDDLKNALQATLPAVEGTQYTLLPQWQTEEPLFYNQRNMFV